MKVFLQAQQDCNKAYIENLMVIKINQSKAALYSRDRIEFSANKLSQTGPLNWFSSLVFFSHSRTEEGINNKAETNSIRKTSMTPKPEEGELDSFASYLSAKDR
ncbi:hypothetical protein [Rheinheimera tangshanensis]|uniref:Uncharacterized protein n=1 Tax=Rheinheimera tangshanensis TaxID=400153 RepID=A0A5C8M0Y4_9GAMM|nr:hypothetical protein [Rheinheimera tangshanensis]TXK83216.1 hypothetical protein FU839_02790 [Rheinheimera tangshanensis]GGM45357.1 hypothetical protein GCM10010920_02090 [Rheinheimera tangshanensis]